jgi:peroxiredoxin
MAVRQLAVPLAALILMASGCTVASGPAALPIAVDEPAPRLLLPDLGGEQIDLGDYKGQVVLLNYWNLSCKPCLEELPTFQALHEEFGDEGLAIVAVHLGGPTKDVENFVTENAYTFTVVVDTQATSTPPLPTTYVIDREGIARHRWVGGPLGREEILKQVEPYLDED